MKTKNTLIALLNTFLAIQSCSDFTLTLEKKIEKTIQKSNSLNYNYYQNVSSIDSRFKFNEKEYSKYQGWIKYTIESSVKKENYSIIIEKANFTLYLIYKGNITEAYPVEFGKNIWDTKTHEGDDCTPEGIRYITKIGDKKIWIDYPNKQEIENFYSLKSLGKIKKTDTIGGGIQIHTGGSGLGKSGNNWTSGCIAMTDADLCKIKKRIDKKTTITIVSYGFKVKR